MARTLGPEALAIVNGLIVLVAGGGLAGNVEGPPPAGWPHTV